MKQSLLLSMLKTVVLLHIFVETDEYFVHDFGMKRKEQHYYYLFFTLS